MVISWKRLGEPIGEGLYAVEGLGFVVADPGLLSAAAQQGTGLDLEITPVTLEDADAGAYRHWVVIDVIRGDARGRMDSEDER